MQNNAKTKRADTGNPAGVPNAPFKHGQTFSQLIKSDSLGLATFKEQRFDLRNHHVQFRDIGLERWAAASTGATTH